MSKDSIAQAVADLIAPVLRRENIDLVDVEYKKEGKNWALRVFIDKPGGVNVDDCQKVSRMIEDMIEVDDLIRYQYVLEVSSPGLERPLKNERDFLRCRNQKIYAHTFAPVGERRDFTGTIEDCREQVLYLNVDGAVTPIPLSAISKARLEIEF